MTNGSDPAFARPKVITKSGQIDGSVGMTIREYFASSALQGILEKNNVLLSDVNVRLAVEYADALIDALNRGK